MYEVMMAIPPERLVAQHDGGGFCRRRKPFVTERFRRCRGALRRVLEVDSHDEPRATCNRAPANSPGRCAWDGFDRPLSNAKPSVVERASRWQMLDVMSEKIGFVASAGMGREHGAPSQGRRLYVSAVFMWIMRARSDSPGDRRSRREARRGHGRRTSSSRRHDDAACTYLRDERRLAADRCEGKILHQSATVTRAFTSRSTSWIAARAGGDRACMASSIPQARRRLT